MHLIDNKDLDKVISHIKSNQSLGKEAFQAGPSYNPADCLGHKEYDELTNKERSRLRKSHGEEYVFSRENKLEISYDTEGNDGDVIIMRKKFDGEGNVTIIVSRYFLIIRGK